MEEVNSMVFSFNEYGSVTLSLENILVMEDDDNQMMLAQIPVFSDSNASVIVVELDELHRFLNSAIVSGLSDWLERKKRREL
jgi:hypothetical protein